MQNNEALDELEAMLQARIQHHQQFGLRGRAAASVIARDMLGDSLKTTDEHG